MKYLDIASSSRAGEHSGPKAGDRRGGDGLMVWCELFTVFSLMLSEWSSQIPDNYWFSVIFHERKYVTCQWFLEYKHAVKVFSLPRSPVPAPGCSIDIH